MPYTLWDLLRLAKLLLARLIIAPILLVLSPVLLIGDLLVRAYYRLL